MKEKIGFLAFHVLFAAFQVTMAIVGLKLISLVFYFAGAVVVLFGLLSFFPGVQFWIETTSDGYSYEANNVKSCLMTLLTTIIIGGIIAVIPQFLQESGLFVPIFTYLVSLFIGLKIMSENSLWEYYLSDATRWIGKIVPCLYMLVIAINILPLLNSLVSISPVIQMVLISIAGAFHLFRTVLVMINDPF